MTNSNQIVLVSQNGIQTHLNLPNQAQLDDWIMKHLEANLKENKMFTAYSITLALRDPENHSIDKSLTPESAEYYIPHSKYEASKHGLIGVQEKVHWLMDSPHLQQAYVFWEEQRQWGKNGVDDPSGDYAITYVSMNVAMKQDDTTQTLPNNNPIPQLKSSNTVPQNDPTLPKPSAAVPTIAWPDLDDVL